MSVSLSFAGTATELWRYTDTTSGHWWSFAAPELEMEEMVCRLDPDTWHPLTSKEVGSRPIEVWEGSVGDDLIFRLWVEVNPLPSFVRFGWELSARRPRLLTKTDSHDNLCYFRCVSDLSCRSTREVNLGSFAHRLHSYMPQAAFVEPGQTAVGPILMEESSDAAWLLAYEHGSPSSNPYLRFAREGDGWRLDAVRGNYSAGQYLSADVPWRSPTFQCGIAAGDVKTLATRYRRFLLDGLATSPAAHEPMMTYNTWFFQEKHRWEHRQNYWDQMTQDRMLAELDAAHQLEVDVFVLDSGWHGAPGTWSTAAERFPEGLDPIIQRARTYGMRVGLWIAPELVSARDAPIFGEALAQRGGQPVPPSPLAGYGGDYRACLIEPGFRQHVLRRMREFCDGWGVRYLKWDFLDLNGCDAPGHGHETAANRPDERRDAYGFQLVHVRGEMADDLTREFPDLLIELDVTESQRPMGLAFLAHGRFFLVNNGPYYRNYGVPRLSRENANLFVWPGAARTWIGRETIAFDSWVPSFLAYMHYLPDGDAASVCTNLGSVLLGHHAWWGDLLTVPPSHLQFIAAHTTAYKSLWPQVLSASLERTGIVSGSPEIYERITENGTGVVVVFATEPTEFAYHTRRPASKDRWLWPGWIVEDSGDRTIRIRGRMAARTAQWAFFGLLADVHARLDAADIPT